MLLRDRQLQPTKYTLSMCSSDLGCCWRAWHLQMVTPRNNNQTTIAAHYASEICELAGCVIATLWERHLDEVMSEQRHSEAAYTAPTESSVWGCPGFVITANPPRSNVFCLDTNCGCFTSMARGFISVRFSFPTFAALVLAMSVKTPDSALFTSFQSCYIQAIVKEALNKCSMKVAFQEHMTPGLIS